MQVKFRKLSRQKLRPQKERLTGFVRMQNPSMKLPVRRLIRAGLQAPLFYSRPEMQISFFTAWQSKPVKKPISQNRKLQEKSQAAIKQQKKCKCLKNIFWTANSQKD